MSSLTNACRDINELTPTAQRACKLFVERCKAVGLNVLITETYRSQERQNYLYEQGRTRPGNKVTWTKNSRHTSRRAWDICQNVKGKEYADSGFFKACGQIAKELGITWGGTWKQADTPHFEISTDWKEPHINIEEDNAMTADEKQKFNMLAERVEKLGQPKMIYNYIDENMPSWARPTIQKLVDKGYLCGDENGLNLDDSMLRLLTILDRAGNFGE